MTPTAPDGQSRADGEDPRPGDHDPDRVVRALRALGHPLRFRIVRALAGRDDTEGEDPCGDCEIVCATRLRLRFGVSAPDLTHHMNILHEAGLVQVHRDGVWVRYELRGSSLPWLASAITGLVSDRVPTDRSPGEAPGE